MASGIITDSIRNAYRWYQEYLPIVSGIPTDGIRNIDRWCQEYRPLVSGIPTDGFRIPTDGVRSGIPTNWQWCQVFPPMVSGIPTDGIRNTSGGEDARQRILFRRRKRRVNILLLYTPQDSGQACRHQPKHISLNADPDADREPDPGFNIKADLDPDSVIKFWIWDSNPDFFTVI